jgi:SAM-dependent methyltransferase
MNPNTINELARAYQKSRILLSGVELDLFTYIDKSGASARQVAKDLKLNEPACERLMNALVSLEFLTKHDQLFFNTEESYTFLSRKGRDYLGGLMHSNHLWNTWSNLTQVVRTGLSANPSEINERGENWLFPFINAMHDRAKKMAPQQLGNIDLAGIISVLDVGGGSGAYSMGFISKKSDIEPVVFDLPNVIPITRQFIEKEGFEGRIKTIEGDYTIDDLPEGFDLAFLSAVIHSNSLEINKELVRKCYKALNANGRIIIQDWIMNNDRTQPLSGAIFAINMLVGTEAGDCYSEQEVTEMLIAAGFTNISRIEFETGLSQVSAQKI